MSAKHTPGPWVHDTSGHPAPDVRAASGRAIAHTWMVCSSTPKSAAGYQARADEDRANARLIAAAPELLAVLEHASHLDTFREFNDYLPTIRAAIAKATGEGA